MLNAASPSTFPLAVSVDVSDIEALSACSQVLFLFSLPAPVGIVSEDVLHHSKCKAGDFAWRCSGARGFSVPGQLASVNQALFAFFFFVGEIYFVIVLYYPHHRFSELLQVPVTECRVLLYLDSFSVAHWKALGEDAQYL